MLKIFTGSLKEIEENVNNYAERNNLEIVNMVDGGDKSVFIFFVIFKTISKD